MGGTSGSDTKSFQPCSSQSKITQTRSVSAGSRNTMAPLEPCCLRFSALVVEKIFIQRSKSWTRVVASIMTVSLSGRIVRRLECVCRLQLHSEGWRGDRADDALMG